MFFPKKITATLGVCLLSLVLVAESQAQEAVSQQEQGEQASAGSPAQTAQRRSPENPTDPERLLDEMTWENGSLIPYGVPRSWFDFKDEVYEKIGLKFGFSYQMVFQYASEVTPDATFDTAVGSWGGFMLRWTLVDRDEDYEGNFVFSMFDRRSLGDSAVPANFGPLDVGATSTVVEYTFWNFAVENLYWEQWLGKNRFMFRVGNQVPTTIMNPFRFKDVRVSFTGSPFAFHEQVPFPTFGFGAAAKWWPVEDSELYVAATVNDMNGDPNNYHMDWSTVSRGEFFYGVEVGHYWRRGEDDFDQLFLDVFYADQRSTRSPDTLPSAAGGGFKVLGSKQIDKWVGWGSYTFNTAGGIGGSFAKHTVTAGAAYLKPLEVPGELGLGFVALNPNEEFTPAGAPTQFNTEVYWRILLSPHIWVTPGIQLIFQPSLNPETDFAAIPHLKFRIAI